MAFPKGGHLVRNLLRRLTRRHHAPQPAPIRKTPLNRTPLCPWQVRDRCFNVRRHGLDPVEIRDFLHRVADELAVAQTALVAVQEENVRIKKALHSWQSAQTADRLYR